LMTCIFRILSVSVVVERLGDALTSISQGLRLSSIKISNP
jgi:hypothetical protein